MVGLKGGDGTWPKLLVRAAIGFDQFYLTRHAQLSVMDPWAQRVLKGKCQFPESDKDWDLEARNRAREAGVKTLVSLPLPGKLGPLGIILVGSARRVRFHPD